MFWTPYMLGDTGKPPLGAPAFYGSALANSLELALAMNEGGGSMVRDHSPARLDQPYSTRFGYTPAVRPLWKTASRGGGPCLDYGDGTAQYELSYPRKGKNRFTATNTVITVMARILFNDISVNSQSIFSVGERFDGNAAFGFSLNGAGTERLCVGSEGGDATCDSGLSPPLGAWCTVGVSQTGTTARTFFLDGVTATNATSIGTSSIGADQPFVVGAGWSNSTIKYTLNGMMAWLFVWSRALSVQQMRAVANDPYFLWRWPKRHVAKSLAAGGTTLFRRTLTNRTGSRAAA